MEKYINPVETEIIVQENQNLKLNELLIFPHGMDGFHIWEAGIILARFITINAELFIGKKILELGTGVGIGGLAASLFTQATNVIMSDYKDEIVKNIIVNSKKNGIQINNKNTDKVQVINLDWTKYQQFEQKFDIIIGSDLIYAGAPVEDLYNLIDKCLLPNGEAYIIIPSQRHFAVKFLEIVDKNKKFSYEKKQLIDVKYFISPLKDEKKGQQTYPGLKELEFYVYIFKQIQNTD